MKRLPTVILLILISSSYFFAQETPTAYPKKECFTTKIESNIINIDGSFDEIEWSKVEWASDYIEFEPDEGKKPAVETSFKILYDDKNLFIAFRCWDNEPDKIVKRMSRRDGFEGDWVEINIDSYHDLRTAFSFTISVSGVKGDEFISNDGNNWDTNWNPIWYAKTAIDSLGWTAEMRIPFSQLRFSNAEEQVWGIQSTRRNFRLQERSVWQGISRNQQGWVSRFGELHGLKNIKPQKQLEIEPYLLGQAESFEKQEGNPFVTGSSTKLSAGVDGKIGITNDLILDFTINPDFGQVEADPSALTLDGFQIFFDERRPFFIESRNIFDYRITGSQAGGNYDNDILFYSRRIGGAPHRNVYSDPSNNYYTDQPDNTTILGAAKFSGKTQDGWSIGILESVTARETAKIAQGDERSEEIVEPLTNYFVGRVMKDFDEGNTIIGGIFTAVNRDLDDPSLNALHKSAYAGGLDFQRLWKDKTWFLGGSGILTRVAGSKEAITNTQTSFEHLFQRPDADHLEVDTSATSLVGHGGTIKIGKFSGKWVFETGMTWRSPNLEFNDVGFLLNTDEINYFLWTGYRINKPFSIFRSLRFNYNHWGRWDFDGTPLYRSLNVNVHSIFKNNWNFSFGGGHDNLDINKNALRGGPALRRPNGMGMFAFLGTDQRKKISLNFNINQGWGWDKAVRFQGYGLGLQIQPINALRISIGPNFNRFQRIFQYVSQQSYNGDTRYIGGRVDQKTFSFTLRLNYNITPEFTIQYYGQPFISKGNYEDFRYITNPVADNFFDRHQAYSADQISFNEATNSYEIFETPGTSPDYSFGKPDFNFIQFRSNLVARWEYIPGSVVFLVWSQGTTSVDDPSRDLFPSLSDNLFGSKIHNIFLIKLSYRFLR